MGDETAHAAFQFSKEYIKERYLEHWGFAEQFGEAFAFELGADPNSVFIDARKLKFAVESTYQDIARYKDYHHENPETDKLDCTKRCAYFIKWIVKFKPIGLVRGEISDDSLDYVELVNEAFALYLFDLHLSDEMNLEVAISVEKARQFAYDLMYRNISVDGWIAIFTLIKDCVQLDVGIQLPSFIEIIEAA